MLVNGKLTQSMYVKWWVCDGFTYIKPPRNLRCLVALSPSNPSRVTPKMELPPSHIEHQIFFNHKRQQLFSSSFNMRLFYDASFDERFEADSLNVLRRTLAQTQAWFNHPSLITRLKLQVRKKGH